MTVEWARNGDVDLAYETFGSSEGEPLLLTAGQTAQMVLWTDEFGTHLAEQGFHVARFDNRDSGLSTHFTSPKKEHPLKKLFLSKGPRPYTGADLSDDVIAVMDALGWDSAHVVGSSLGGMIVQATALRYPHRVRTLTSIMSPPGDAGWKMLFYVNFRTVARFSRLRLSGSREDAVQQFVEMTRMLSSPGYPFDEDQARELGELSYDRRPVDPTAYQRQSGATWPGGKLRDVRIPTLVIHGENDPLIRALGGRAVAKAIPGARYVGYAGMGHDTLTKQLWPSIIDEIKALTAPSGVGQHSATASDPLNQ